MKKYYITHDCVCHLWIGYQPTSEILLETEKLSKAIRCLLDHGADESAIRRAYPSWNFGMSDEWNLEIVALEELTGRV